MHGQRVETFRKADVIALGMQSDSKTPPWNMYEVYCEFIATRSRKVSVSDPQKAVMLARTAAKKVGSANGNRTRV